ncbi:MAG: PilT/PilU family type 4a pilus ATPase [Planctomycetes bacterium]|nr:PilT/PilU family type 4a pilus ATPase [Planctomycetota bacterium]
MINSPKEHFSALLKAARRHNASDIHLIAKLPPAYRVGGEIVMAAADPISREDLITLAKSILTPQQLARFEEARELCVSYHHEECGRIRLSLYHRLNVPEMAIRMCNTEILTSETLLLPPIVDEWARLPSGLILVTGPTGVGKTTTLNYMIDMINVTRKCKIITIEDPVEYEHSHRKSIVVQIEVTTDTNSFSSCLRHSLRLDPDVICIGEMRDVETIETALIAAETGHLVLATLHTPSAPGAVERIVTVFEGSRQPQVMMQLSDILQGVIAQRLVPTFDKKSRVLACEVLVTNSAVKNIIREGRFHHFMNAMMTARDKGSQTMEESLANHYRAGTISLDTAMAHTIRPEVLEGLLKM